jgi:galactose mutarotase-like enzyme
MKNKGPRDPFTRRASGHYGRLALWEGHEIVEMTSPEIHLKVSLTRGAEILELRSKKLDLELLWHGQEDIVRHREGVESTQAPMGNFLDHFSGGWQEVLPNAQYPIDYKGASFGGHGEVAMLSWDYRVLQDSEKSISVEFSVNLRRMPLRLIRVMTLTNGELRFDESVENLSGEEIEFQWGQHLVIGGPFIDPGMEIIVNAGEPIEVPNYPGPTYRFKPDSQSKWPTALDSKGEVVDVSTFGADDGTDGHINASLQTDITLEWDKKVFPYCWIWMVLGGIKTWPLWGKERLITIEPFSSPVISLTEAIEQDKALRLSGHQSIKSWVSFTLY